MFNNRLSIVFQVTIIFVVCNAFELQSRIYKGYEIERGKFPYFALLEILNQTSEKLTSVCGATLISDQWVLTAAHCLPKGDVINVHLGMVSANDSLHADSDVISVTTEDMHVHPNYKWKRLMNDIGLIKLPRKPVKSQFIQPIQLPKECGTLEKVETLTMGFGATTRAKLSPVLQYAFLKTTDLSKCLKPWEIVWFARSVICAGSDKMQSVSKGDSGGPLVRMYDRTLIGVTSFGSSRSTIESIKPQGKQT